MNTLLRLLLVVSGFALASLARAADMAVPFRKLSLDEATAAAVAEKKLVFVDFYTTWCEPCKRLDALTFTDAAVGKLVGDKAVALKLDAEKEGRDAAKRYRVNSYPSLLVLKADGTEVERIVGYKEPAAFKAEFARLVAMADTGKSGLEKAKEVVAKADDDEAQPHFELGQKLARAGDNEAALTEFLWAWDEGRKDPEFSRFMRARVPMELAMLARNHPPAREALIVRRDQTRERVLAGKGGTTLAKDLIDLNKALGAEDDSLTVLDQVPEGDPRRTTFTIYLFQQLVEKQRYKEAVGGRRVDTSLRTLESIVSMARQRAEKSGGAENVQGQVASGMRMSAKTFEAYVGAGQLDDARTLADKMLSIDGSDETRRLLHEHAARAGKPELYPAPGAAVEKRGN